MDVFALPVRINGEEHSIEGAEPLEGLLERTGNYNPFMVVALNGVFLRRDDWSRCYVEDGDEIRTVDMIAGG